MTVRPGIVQTGKFIPNNHQTFANYINYIDRNEAMRNAAFEKYNAISYDGYNDYMLNPLKSNGLFTANKNTLNATERNDLKHLFKQAQQNGSVMWQNVISFDNHFLEQQGLFDPVNQTLNQDKLQAAIRSGMNKLLSEEGLSDSAVWSASIHLNTDNIHVHVATVEPNPTRPIKKIVDPKTHRVREERKGYIKKKSYDAFKSAVANDLLNRNHSLERLSHLIRDQLPNEHSWQALNDRKYLTMYRNIRSRLPANHQLWRYNVNALDAVRPIIDQMTTQYLLEYKPALLNEFDTLLKQEVVFREALYGTGQQGKEFNRAQDYLKNKYHELYSKMGNSVLSEMRLADQQSLPKYKLKEKQPTNIYQKPVQSPTTAIRAMKSIKKQFSRNVEQERGVKQYMKELEQQTQQEEQLYR